jgi:general secretion pathway protein D
MRIMHKFSGVIFYAVMALSVTAYTQQGPPGNRPGNKSAAAEVRSPGTATAGDARQGPKSLYSAIELRPREARLSFHIRGDERSVIPQILGAYDILVNLDGSVKAQAVSFDGDDLTFAEAAELVKLITGTFFAPLDSHRALVLADNRENRSRFARLVERKIYLPTASAAEAAEIQTIAQSIFDIEQGFAQDSQGGITLRASPEKAEAMSRSLAELFQPRSEVLLEVRIGEIDRTVDTNRGTLPPTSATLFNVRSEINSIIATNASLVEQIIASGLASAGDYSAILAALLASGELTGTVFNNPFVLFGGGLTESGVEWNTTSASMLLSSSDVRSVSEMQLRVMDDEEAAFRAGQRYPIMTSSYTAVSASSSSAASALTIPQVQYQNLGLTLKIRPSIRSGNEVSLNIDLALSSLAGSTINNIPILANRQYSGTVTGHFGTSAVIVSAMSRQDARAITGLPGLSDISSLRDGTNHQESTDSLDLVIMVSPHLIGLSHPETASPMLLLSPP